MNLDKFYEVVNEIEGHGGLGMRMPGGTARFMYGLAKAMEAESYVDVGTFVGLSSLWVARAMEEQGKGKVYTVELDPKWYKMSIEFARKAGLSHRIEACLGDSRKYLPTLRQKLNSVDLVLLDSGDKALYKIDFENLEPLFTDDTIIMAHDTMKQDKLPFVCAEPFRNWIIEKENYHCFHLNKEYGALFIQKESGFKA
jgi:predicted O-methyltransferase YrrM